MCDAPGMRDETNVVPIEVLARRLGLSRRWLHREAQAERIPSLRAGRRRLFNPEAVRRALAARAAETEGCHA